MPRTIRARGRRGPRRGREARRDARDGALAAIRPRTCWLRDDFCDQCAARADEARAPIASTWRSSWAIRTARAARATTPRPCCAAGASSASTSSRSCPTTRCSTSSATSRRATDAVRVRAGGPHVRPHDLRGPVVRRSPPRRRRRRAPSCSSSINASPFHRGKQAERYQRMGARVQRDDAAAALRAPGGRPGRARLRRRSFALDGRWHARRYQAETLRARRVRRASTLDGATRVRSGADGAAAHRGGDEVYRALVTGRARLRRTRTAFPGVLLGLSGGIDSALVLAICVDALGAERVRAVMMPSPLHRVHEHSRTRARWRDPRRALRRDRDRAGRSRPSARRSRRDVRGRGRTRPRRTSRRASAARCSWRCRTSSAAIVLTTGNKSEMATGYCTLYGDMAGGFAVIKDVLKTLVYRLAPGATRESARVIPQRMIDRPPSAELRAGPDRPGHPAALRGAGRDPRALHGGRPWPSSRSSRLGFDRRTVERVVRLIQLNEYKRRQAPAGHPHHAARLRQGLALSYHVGLPAIALAQSLPSRFRREEQARAA